MSGPWWEETISRAVVVVVTHDGSAGPTCGMRCFDEPPSQWDEGTNDELPVPGIAEYPARIGS